MKEQQECRTNEDIIKIVMYILRAFWTNAGLCYLGYLINESITISLLTFISVNLLVTMAVTPSFNNTNGDSEKKQEQPEINKSEIQ